MENQLADLDLIGLLHTVLEYIRITVLCSYTLFLHTLKLKKESNTYLTHVCWHFDIAGADRSWWKGMKTCKWAPFHLHGHELWPTGTHPHAIPPAHFPGMLVRPHHTQTSWYYPRPRPPPTWNGVSTSFKIPPIPGYQYPMTSLDLPTLTSCPTPSSTC